MYVYMCVCVCVCMRGAEALSGPSARGEETQVAVQAGKKEKIEEKIERKKYEGNITQMCAWLV